MDPFSIIDNNVVRKMAENMSMEDVNRFCITSKRFNDAICNNVYFWQDRLQRDFGKTSSNPKETYMSLYTFYTQPFYELKQYALQNGLVYENFYFFNLFYPQLKRKMEKINMLYAGQDWVQQLEQSIQALEQLETRVQMNRVERLLKTKGYYSLFQWDHNDRSISRRAMTLFNELGERYYNGEIHLRDLATPEYAIEIGKTLTNPRRLMFEQHELENEQVELPSRKIVFGCVRPYNAKDIPQLKKLIASAFGEFNQQDEEIYNEEWWNDNQGYVMEDAQANRLLGFMVYETIRQPRRFYIHLVGVRKEYQGLGIGTRILNTFLKQVADQQNIAVEMHVETDNPKALNLYTKVGFKNMGLMEDWQDHFYKPVYFLFRQPNNSDRYIGERICLHCKNETELCDPRSKMPFCSKSCRSNYMKIQTVHKPYRCIHNHWIVGTYPYVDNLEFRAAHNSDPGVTIVYQDPRDTLQVGMQYVPVGETGFEAHTYETQYIQVVTGYGNVFVGKNTPPKQLSPGEVVLIPYGTQHNIVAETPLRLITLYAKSRLDLPFTHTKKLVPQ